MFWLFAASIAISQINGLVPIESSHWHLEGDAKLSEYLDRKTIRVDGGSAELDNVVMQDGVIDVDVATPAGRGFFGIQFRIEEDSNGEWVYLRQHKSGLPDAIQYTPVLRTGLNWQLYNGAGFTAAVAIPRNKWFHIKLVVTGAQAKFYVSDMEKPALVIDDLKSGIRKGKVALAVLTGETYFSNFRIQLTPSSVWQRHWPAVRRGALTKWSLSPSYDALTRDLEMPLSKAETNTIEWQPIEAEAPGLVPIYRYRDAPHPRVSFANDFSKRLEPQPGMKVVYARTSIEADSDQTRRLNIGYSDEVSVFLNGQILYRGRSAQNFRDPGFLGIVNPENDSVYLPLKKGNNELVLAISELGGGWGFICQLEDMK